MIAAILADEQLRDEIMEKGVAERTEIIWADSLQSLRIIEADVYFDLLFEYDRERMSRLQYLHPKPVFVNDVIHVHDRFIRLNAWPGMLKRNEVEIACHDFANSKHSIDAVFENMGWKFQVVPNITGMVTPRIVSMIINEAYYALGDGVSTMEEIDVAMKLGTNYPYGPFEWSTKIGISNVAALLRELSSEDQRYTIAPLLNNK
jgi:3-hydroxybutyryl-CoA dehydrogenase